MKKQKPYAKALDRLMLYLSVFVIMGISDAVVPILPELSNGTALTNGFASSLIFSSFFIGALLTMIPFGVLADACGNRLFIIVGIFLTLVSGLAILLSDNIWVIITARLIEGAGCGAFFPAALSMLSDFPKRGQYIGEFNALLNLGLASGLLMAGILASPLFIKNGVLLFEGLMVPVFMISLMILINNGKGDPISNKSEILTFLQKSGNVFIHPEYVLIWLLSFILFGSSGVMIALYSDFSIGSLEKGVLGTYLASVYLGAMITSFIGGRLPISNDVLVKSGMVVTGLGALGSIFHPLGLTLMGAGSGLGLVGLITGVSYLDIEKGLVMGVFNTCTYAGLALVPLISGLMLSTLDYGGVFFVNGILLIGMCLLPVEALKKKNDKDDGIRIFKT